MKPLLRVVSGLLVLAAASLSAAERVALLVGCGDYVHATPLDSPKHDVAAMRAVLTSPDMGFQVTELMNPNNEAFLRAVKKFRADAQGARVAMVYFSGHGMEHEGQNYLITINAELETAEQLETQTMPLEKVMDALEGSGATVKLAVLDCCRDDKFAQTKSWSRTKSLRAQALAALGPAQIPEATLVCFATSAGRTALDKLDESSTASPFTSLLSRELQTPGLSLRDVFDRVHDGMQEATESRQVPVVQASNALSEVFRKTILIPSKSGIVRPSTPPAEAPVMPVPAPKPAPAPKPRPAPATASSSSKTDPSFAQSRLCMQRLESNADVPGENVDSDPAQSSLSFKAFERAAQGGDAFARAAYASFLMRGWGCTEDVETGFAEAEAAYEAGEAYGAYVLSKFYLEGRHVKKDEARATELLKEAAEGGATVAMVNLAQLLLKDNATPREKKQAIQYLETAAEQNEWMAYGLLGVCYIQGNGVLADYQKGVQYLTKSANAGVSVAMFFLAVEYLKAFNGPMAYQAAIASANAGYGRGMILASLCHMGGIGCPINPQQAGYAQGQAVQYFGQATTNQWTKEQFTFIANVWQAALQQNGASMDPQMRNFYLQLIEQMKQMVQNAN